MTLAPRRFLVFGFILTLSLLWRLYLAPQTYHVDLKLQAEWGQYVGQKGPLNIYDYGTWTFAWPNDPPLNILIYGLSYRIYNQLFYFLPRTALFLVNHTALPIDLTTSYQNFTLKFNTIVSPEIPFPMGFLLCLKIWTILGDLLLGILIYFLAEKISRRGLLFASIYLFSPFSFYLSGAWGQTNQLGYFFHLLGFLFIYFAPYFSLPILWLGISLKPTALLLLPTYLYLSYRYKKLTKIFFPGVFILLLCTYLYLRPFTNQPVPTYLFNKIIPTVFNRGEIRLTTNSFNFWHIFTLNKNVDQETVHILFPTKYYAYILLTIIHLFAFKKFYSSTHKPNSKLKIIINILNVLFATSAGIWIFSTNMLDRYYFAGVVTGLLVCIPRPKLLYLWIPISLIFWLNLTRGFWYPGILVHLETILQANQGLAGLPLSLLNVILYILFVKRLFAGVHQSK